MEQRQQLVLKIWTPTLTSAKGMGKPLDFSSPWGWSVLQDGIQKVQWGCKTLQQPAAPAMQRKAASCVKLISSAWVLGSCSTPARVVRCVDVGSLGCRSWCYH